MKKFFVNISGYSANSGQEEYLNGYVVIYADNEDIAVKLANLMYPNLTAYFANEEEPE